MGFNLLHNVKCFEGVHFTPPCCISCAILTVNGLSQYIVVTALLSKNYYVAVYCGVTDTNFTMVFLKTPSPRSMEYAYLSLSGLCAFQLWPPCQNSTNRALNISKCTIFQVGRVVILIASAATAIPILTTVQSETNRLPIQSRGTQLDQCKVQNVNLW